VDEITVQGILYALSDPVRLRIFAQLAAAECPRNCSAFCHVGATPLPKSSLSQHFKVLREAGLIRSERKGVELQNRTRCEEIKHRFGPLLKAIVAEFEAGSQKDGPAHAAPSRTKARGRPGASK
jgi:DNA-binding transcriptional ArsR family regulator